MPSRTASTAHWRRSTVHQALVLRTTTITTTAVISAAAASLISHFWWGWRPWSCCLTWRLKWTQIKPLTTLLDQPTRWRLSTSSTLWPISLWETAVQLILILQQCSEEFLVGCCFVSRSNCCQISRRIYLFQALTWIRPEFSTNWPDPKWFPETMISCMCRLTLMCLPCIGIGIDWRKINSSSINISIIIISIGLHTDQYNCTLSWASWVIDWVLWGVEKWSFYWQYPKASELWIRPGNLISNHE